MIHEWENLMVSNKVLLVGNDVNLINNQYSWSDLLQELIGFVGKRGVISIGKKPFPLLYEEICLRGLQYSSIKEEEIKVFIADLSKRLTSSTIHKQILACEFPHVLTTNYDYSFETCLSPEITPDRSHRHVREKVHSLYRQTRLGRTTLWHIHGEISSPSSIMLGYDHYAKVLWRVQEHIYRGIKYSSGKIVSLIKRSQLQLEAADCWVDLFLTRDVYIIGFSLDFNELPLWWLLTFRARNPSMIGPNKITYVYPKALENDIRDKLDILQISNVKLMPLDNFSDKDKYYKEAILRIQSD